MIASCINLSFFFRLNELVKEGKDGGGIRDVKKQLEDLK